MRLVLIIAVVTLLSACIEPSPSPTPNPTPTSKYHVIKSSQQ